MKEPLKPDTSRSENCAPLDHRRREYRIAQCLFDQSFDGRRQFKNGIDQWLVAHGFIGESSTLVACARRVSRGDQGSTKISVVLKNRERKRLRRVVGLEAIANKQASLNIIELVVVFSPVGRAVQPVAAMALKIADAGEFEPFEIIRLVQRVLEIGIAADRVEGSVFVDFCTLECNGPGYLAVESRGDLSAVDTRELEERLERLRVVDESRLARR